MRVRRFLPLILAILLACAALADDVRVVRNVNLRADPSTANNPIRLLTPPDELELIEAEQTSGYYRVRTDGGEEGWVWGKNVRRLEAPEQPTPGAAAVANTIDAQWRSAPPNDTQFTRSDGTVCGSFGTAKSDASKQVNRYKNRTNQPQPATYHDISFEAFRNLPDPDKPPSQWSDAQRAEVESFHDIPVRIQGFLVALKDKGSAESTNCGFKKQNEVDWHMALAEQAGQGEDESMVIETTPRVRRSHPKWTAERLKPWVDADNPIRVSGWIMFDPQHRNHMGKYRASMWEVHPIMRIEVFTDEGLWVDVDDMD